MKKLFNIICVMIITFLSISVAGDIKCFAIGETSREDYYIDEGVTESTVYVTVNGGYNVRVHILRIEASAPVMFKASYGNYYGKGSTEKSRSHKAKKWNKDDWNFSSVREQVIEYSKSYDAIGGVIAATNGDRFDLKSGEPEGSLIIEGHILRSNTERPYVAVLKSGKVVVRKAGSSLKNVEEGIGGDEILVWDGKIVVGTDRKANTDNDRMPREAIGTCDDGTVIMVSLDGREPASAGATRMELAQIMKGQGCTRAINLDGGGSASFMTKRMGDERIEFRSNHSDGPERNVSSTLLVVKSGSRSRSIGNKIKTVSMANKRTKLSKDSKGVYHYKINGKLQSGFFTINGKSYLFSEGVGITKNIKIGNIIYRFRKGVLKSASDMKAGNVVIGYCGASDKKGTNLLYAFHYGNRRLVIGTNPLSKNKSGKMKELTSSEIVFMPWYSVRMDIKQVYIGNGVENIGAYFLYSQKEKMPGGAKPPICQLESIRLPSSISKIGAYSLYNKPKLKNVKMPSKLKTIGKAALMYSGRNTITFKSKVPPQIGKKALKKTAFNVIYVRKTPAWKKFIKQKAFKKIGYTKIIKYK